MDVVSASLRFDQIAVHKVAGGVHHLPEVAQRRASRVSKSSYSEEEDPAHSVRIPPWVLLS